jgi:hypothetical protein
MRYLLLDYLRTIFRHHVYLFIYLLISICLIDLAIITKQDQSLNTRHQSMRTTNYISPSTFLTVYFYSFYVFMTATWTFTTFFEPFAYTIRMVLMVTYEFCICILIQTNTARCFYLFQWQSLRGMLRPSNLG